MRPNLPLHVHRKRAKGRTYYYFATGTTTVQGKLILARLPDITSKGFGRAYNALLDAREKRTHGTAELTVPVLCEKFRRSPRFAKLAASTQESYRTYLAVIEDQLDTFLAGDVEPKDVLALMQKMADRPGAANQAVRTLSALYAWGKKPEIGLVKSNPAAGIELYEGGEHQPWSDSLLAAALAAKDDNVRLAARLLYYTAQRVSDVVKMKWTDIQADGTLYVKQRKTGAELHIPIHRELQATLDRMPRALTTIIAKPNGRPYTEWTIRYWLQEFAGKHGVEIVPHGLRKNAVNALLEAGCSAAQTAAISGQSLQMVEHYAKKRNRRKLASAAILKWENAK